MLHKLKDKFRTNFTSSQYVFHFNKVVTDEKWGPAPAEMDELADMYPTGYVDLLPEMQLRLDERQTSWRRCYKTLLLIEHFARCLHERYLPDLHAFLPTIHQIAADYFYTDKSGVDRGVSVRERAKKLGVLLRDSEALRAERAKADKLKQINGIGSNGGGDFNSGGASGGTARFTGYGSGVPPNAAPLAAGGPQPFKLDEPLANSAQASPQNSGSGAPPSAPRSAVLAEKAARAEQEAVDRRLAMELQQQQERDRGSPTVANQTGKQSVSPPRGGDGRRTSAGSSPYGLAAGVNPAFAAPQAGEDFGAFVSATTPTTAQPVATPSSGAAVTLPPASAGPKPAAHDLDFLTTPAPAPAKPAPATTIDDLFGPPVAVPASQPTTTAGSPQIPVPLTTANPTTTSLDLFGPSTSATAQKNVPVSQLGALPQQQQHRAW